MLIVAFLISIFAIPAFAFDDSTLQSIERYCQTTKDPAHCLASWKRDAQRSEQMDAREAAQRARPAPVGAADSLSLMAMMWMFPQSIYQPHFLPAAHSHWGNVVTMPNMVTMPLRCQSFALGNTINTSCY